MKSFFFKLKHWQLFLLFFLPIAYGYINFLNNFFGMVLTQGDPGDEQFIKTMWIMLWGVSFMILLFNGWMLTIGFTLQKYIPKELKMNKALFAVSILIPLIFYALFYNFIFKVMGGQGDFDFLEYNFGYLFLVQIIVMVCSFYSYYYTGKTLKLYELKRPVTFSDYAGEFFMIWFFFVGVWIIQPRLNKWIKEMEDPAFLDRYGEF